MPSKMKGDKRLPFGLPGVNKAEEGLERQLSLDLLFLQLSERERPRGFRHVVPGVERRPRRERRAPEDHRDRRVDVMIDIRGNFFYTRTVPCQLWFFDRQGEGRGTARPGADARRAQHFPQGLALGLRFLAGAAEEHRRHRLALSRPEATVPGASGKLSGRSATQTAKAATGRFRRFEEALGKLVDLMALREALEREKTRWPSRGQNSPAPARR